MKEERYERVSERRGKPLKKRKKKRSNNNVGSLRLPMLIGFLVLVIMAALAVMLPVFDVTEIVCEGNTSVQTGDLLAAAELTTGKNIFLENLGSARRKIEAIHYVKKAEVRRKFPNKIYIEVEERLPIAYLSAEDGCSLLAEDGIVIDKYTGEEADLIIDERTPAFLDDQNTDKESQNEEKSSSDNDGGDKNSETGSDEEEKVVTAEDEEQQNEDADSSDESGTDGSENEENNSEWKSVPYIKGVTLKKAEQGKKAAAEDKDKINNVYTLCGALNKAGLLNRITYIDLENLNDVKIVAENRIEIWMGSLDNIEYRCSFIAEVINTKLSATEEVILDYTGNDVYAIARDDGKDRVKKSEKPKEDKEDGKTDNNTDDSAEDDEDSDKEEDTEEESAQENDIYTYDESEL